MDLEQHLKRQMAFSKATFGPGTRQNGVTDHIEQEIQEIRDGDNDPREWVDVVLLSLDGLWRSIAFDETNQYELENYMKQNLSIWDDIPMLCSILIQEKQSKNEQRDWPDWRTADPNKAINHDRSKD